MRGSRSSAWCGVHGVSSDYLLGGGGVGVHIPPR